MSKHSNVESFLSFINTIFADTEGQINLCVLRNSAGGAGPQITSDNPDALTKFVVKNDKPGWGTYVCVSTMLSAKHHHAKESIAEIPVLHIDIDSKDITDAKEDVIRKLKALRLPPSLLVDSGNGVHAYWKFREALGPNVSSDDIERIEAALKLLCDLVGGDIKVTQPSAVMRLPGTFNTKNENQNHEVMVVWKNGGNGKAELATYELDDIEEWLAEASPVILRKVRPQAKTVQQSDENPFERIGRTMGYAPPIDVEKRLGEMMYMGGGDNAIHATQVSVSASLLEGGEDVGNIVALLMDATRNAAGDYGLRWNWKAEERNIRKMCETWLKKRERAGDRPNKVKAHTNGRDHDGGKDHRERPQSTAGPASPTETKTEVKDKKRPFHITVAEAFFINMEELGNDLRIFVDSKGNENLWKFEDGLWSLVMNIEAWLDGQIEEIIRGLKSTNKSTNRICAEARKYILRSPNVRKLQRNPFDRHGKIPVHGTLIDPYTLKVEPIKKEHYCTWTLNINYDPKAKCVWWERMLADTFGDRSKEDCNNNIVLLQDFLGASLIDNKSKALRRALILIGDSNSGKSSLIDVMSGLITDEPITTPISDLTGNHGMQSFIRRSPWVLHEAFDQSAWHISSKAKLILGGDFYEVNPKGKNAISMSFTAPAIWATNHEPKFKESTKAMINRMIMMRVSNIFDADNEIGAAAEARRRKYQEPQDFVLAEEKSGILNWALVGAERAINRGHFRDTAEGLEALHDVRLDSNFVAGFVEECVTFNPDVRMSAPDFNAAFMSWWREHRGDERTVSPDQIGRALKALSHAKIGIDRHKFRNNKGLRFYVGIEFNESGEDHWKNTSDALSTPGFGNSGDLARMSSDVRSVTSTIPTEWCEHPAVVKIKINAEREKLKPRF